MRQLKLGLIGVVVMLASSGAWADLLGAAQPGAAQNGELAESIALETSAASDGQIEQRISGILGELYADNSIEVAVDDGVVTLSGSAPNSNQAQQALGVAERVAGVVAVRDAIDRTLKVQDNLSPVVQSVQDMTQRTLRALPLILLALIVMALIIALGWFLSGRALIRRFAPNPFVAELVSQIVIVISVIIALVVGLSLIGAAALLGTLLGGAGVIGIAIGFAVRDTIENYIASIMLSLRQPFRGGDHVVIDEREGIVIRLTTRATVLMTMDGNHLRIPNAQVFKGVILNYTTNPERRFEFELGVDADDDPIDAVSLGLEQLSSLGFVLDSPKPDAWVVEVGDSNIVIRFLGWVDQRHTDFLKARSLAIAQLKTVLEQGGFSLPEPIYRVRLDTSKASDLLVNQTPSSVDGQADSESNALASDSSQSAGFSGGASPPSASKHSAGLGSAIDVSPDRELQDKAQKEQVGEDNLLSEQARSE